MKNNVNNKGNQKNVKKINYVEVNEKAVINPYTFVPVNRDFVKRENAEKYYCNETLKTGVMHCTLKTITPLSIPDIEGVKMEESGHKTYSFYKENDKYAIPGSTIRGVLRSNYAALTNSCFVTLKPNTTLSKRIPAKFPYKAGIICVENDSIKLYEAERIPVKVNKNNIIVSSGIRYLVNNNQKYKTGDYVTYDNGKLKKVDGDTLEAGLLYVGEEISKKHNESIFKVTQRLISENVDVLKDAMVRLKGTKSDYQNPSINKNIAKGHTGYKSYDALFDKYEQIISCKKGFVHIPVWYSISSKGAVYLSLAAIGRQAYLNTVDSLVGKLTPCETRDNVCEACLLFGMIGKNNKQLSMGSRIRITNAYINDVDAGNISEEILLKELSTPRTSYLPFYAVNTAKPKEKVNSYDYRNASISGRKFYWHNYKAIKSDSSYTTKEKNNRNNTVEVIKPDNTFTFDIYYDGITDEQWKKLLWTVTCGDNSEVENVLDYDIYKGMLCHKMGHGKPLGLGSVKITVDCCEERTFKEGTYYVKSISKDKISENLKSGIEWTISEAWEKIVDVSEPFNSQRDSSFESEEIEICYPYVLKDEEFEGNSNSAASHQWFKEFEKLSKVFPEAVQKNQSLNLYKAVNNNNE